MKKMEDLVRPNIFALAQQLSDCEEQTLPEAEVRLNANESPFNVPYNRYPSAQEGRLKEAVSRWRGIRQDCIFVGNGTGEIADLAMRTFCIPRRDNVVAIDPTCAHFVHSAAVNDVEYRRVPLNDDFSLTAASVLNACSDRTKIIFLCSPNNPTGNLLKREEILAVAQGFEGLVVVDEAYIDFCAQKSLLYDLPQARNLIVLQTFSTAFASAGLRLGVAFATPEVVKMLNCAGRPHSVSSLVLEKGLEMVDRRFDVEKWVKQILDERTKVMNAIRQLPFVEKIFPSETNFLLVRVKDVSRLYDYLLGRGIAVCNCSEERLCSGCLRITIGLPSENNTLLSALRTFIE